MGRILHHEQEHQVLLQTSAWSKNATAEKWSSGQMSAALATTERKREVTAAK